MEFAVLERARGISLPVRTRVEATLPQRMEIYPIPEMTSDDVLKLATGYASDWPSARKTNTNSMNNLQAWVLGRVDIQRLSLGMLGQKRLLSQGEFEKPKPGFDPVIQFMEEVRQVTAKDIRTLAEMYRRKSKTVKDQRIYERKWALEKITPAEERVLANMEELSRVLAHFGQSRLTLMIDKGGPDLIDWGKMREEAKTNKVEVY